jgi:hypothetical protein
MTMAQQPPYNWRVPLDTDRPAGARQMRELAEDIATTLTNGFGAAAQAHNAAVINNRASGWSQISLDTIINPVPGLYALTGGSIQVTRAGVYLATWNITTNGSIINRLVTSIRTGQGERIYEYGGQASMGAPGFSTTIGFGGARPVTLTAGGAVELWAFHDPAGQNIGAGGAHLELVALHI